jgi:glutaminyl-tRNA synthetase
MAAIASETLAPSEEDMAAFFVQAGFSDKDAKKNAKSKKTASALYSTLQEANSPAQLSKEELNLLIMVATKTPKTHVEYRPVLATMVVEGKLDINPRVQAACDYLKQKITPGNPLDQAKLETECGVGLNMDEDEIIALTDKVFADNAAEIETQRYLFGISKLLPLFKNADPRAKWANGGMVTKALKNKLAAVLGPKDERDEAMNKAKNKSKGKEKKAKVVANSKKDGAVAGEGAKAYDDDATNMFRDAARMESSFFNSDEKKKEHFEVTKGIVRTRFPPEPNGYLHIGHAKSMNLVFKGAYEMLGGVKGMCNLRFDDTNPAAESTEFVDSIKENVNWMGWKPWAVTYSSDHFDTLYEFAERLIKDGKSYVCNQSGDEIKRCRDLRRDNKPGYESPCRNRPVEENLELFRAMRDGKYKEGELSLRLKIDWEHPNPNMWDPVAYRIKHMAHPHAGDKWCIYPTYDYTHCIIDSLEHIDYSLCTLEFEVRRDSYYWLVDQLGLWKALQYEFSRLNIEYFCLSKRKLKVLVEENYVTGWDDPRLPTINGLRRRGFTSEGINAFCDDIGVNRHDNTLVEISRLHYWVRWHLDQVARRAFAVLDPIEIEITNYPEGQIEMLELPNHPKTEMGMGNRSVPFSRKLYINREDFREENPGKKYFGLAPGKEVKLKYAYNITCTGMERDASNNVVKLLATYDAENKSKCKGVLTWVAHGEGGAAPATAEVRLYDELFTQKVPGSDGRDWLKDDLNPNSLTVVTALIDSSLVDVKPQDRFQFERVGYFVVDDDSKPGALVFNRTLPLKASSDAKKI